MKSLSSVCLFFSAVLVMLKNHFFFGNGGSALLGEGWGDPPPFRIEEGLAEDDQLGLGLEDDELEEDDDGMILSFRRSCRRSRNWE
jgi:hypothetical protein